jgi:Cys-rich protein (TIGR01571 family)
MTTPGANQWPTNLTACCASPGGLPRFCLACWCPCVSYSELLKEPELKGYCCYGDRISACVSYALLQTLGIFPAAALHAGARSTLRGERNYSGSLGEDFCATACCSTCALVQELNAADLRQQQQQQQAATVGAPMPMRMTSRSMGLRTPGGLRPDLSQAGVEDPQQRSRSRQPTAARAQSGAPLGAPAPASDRRAQRPLVL